MLPLFQEQIRLSQIALRSGISQHTTQRCLTYPCREGRVLRHIRCFGMIDREYSLSKLLFELRQSLLQSTNLGVSSTLKVSIKSFGGVDQEVSRINLYRFCTAASPEIVFSLS